MKCYVSEQLEKASDLYNERNKVYKDNYKNVGDIFKILFPDGITIISPGEYNRFALFMNILNKLTRYCYNWDIGHPDSLDDIAVYVMMLKELDNEYL